MSPDDETLAFAAELIQQVRHRLEICDGEMSERDLRTLVEALARDLAGDPPLVIMCPHCGVPVV